METKIKGRSFLDEVRLGEYGWCDGFDEVLDEAGIELRDIDLYPLEVQNKIEEKLRKCLEI